ncbi:sensor histidine kinase [Dactylosporangium sp. CS-033363]|uniref:sensor histidine kinase n=1 Tax=Dactylosporangium sp. CS-033363 TaxID=3239935 RepID=UPI003D91582B
MPASNRLRWRLTLLYSLATLVSGAVLILIVISLSAGLPPTDVAQTPRSMGLPRPPRVETGVRIGSADSETQNFKERVLITPGLALLIMVPISLGVGWLIAGRMLRPVRTMTGRLQRISGRNVHERLAVEGPRDEFKELADTIDALLGRLETALDGHKRFVANAAHELRTPLTVEHALLEEPLIDPEAGVEEYRASFERLLAVNRQRGALLESLLTLAGSESARETGVPVDLDAVVRDALHGLAGETTGGVTGGTAGGTPVSVAGGLTVTATIRPARILGDPTLLARLVANLLDNAIHYNTPGGTVEVGTRQLDGYARLIITNTGPEVPPDQVERLFEPFQRLRRVADDGHHGLGLSIVRAIATVHGATLQARPRPGGGLSVQVLFPVDHVG